jgi:hypothetical protein
MASFTEIAGYDVAVAFAFSCGPIMAGYTVVTDGCVIKSGWYPGLGYMTATAIFVGGNVEDMFTGCNHAVVAT